jgi:hypothetical protein
LREFVDRDVYKRTAANRFETFDDEALKIIGLNFTNDASLNVSDVAVSDGRTALDFFEKLDKRFRVAGYGCQRLSLRCKRLEKRRHYGNSRQR